VNIELRAARDQDFAFARRVYFETMRWIIERLFGWDQAREEKSFVQFFKLDEVRIITADGQDVGWIQERVEGTTIFLGSFLRDADDAAARHWDASPSDTAGTSQESIKSNYVSCGKDKLGSPLLREARVSDYPRGRAQVLHEG